MAFTTIIGADGVQNVFLDQGNAIDSPTPYFHPEDIERVLRQTGAKAVQVVKAKVGRAQNQRDSVVLIALREPLPPSGSTGDRIVNINASGMNSGLAAIGCPPFNRDGSSNLPEDPPIPSS